MSLALVLAAALAAAPFADPAAIDREVAAFAGADPRGGAPVPVDRRLRLRRCDAPLALAWHVGARATVLVQCPDPGGWRLYVAVAGAAGGAGAEAVVARGDAVAIAVTGEGFAVSQPGEALEAGAVGAWIKVRTAAAARTGLPGGARSAEALRARIVRPGLVELPLP